MLHPDYESLSTARFEKDGVHIIYCGNMMVKKKGQEKTYFNKRELVMVAAKAAFSLYREARKIQTDLYILCKPQPVNSIAMLMLKKPFVVDCDDYEAESNRLSKIQKRVFVYFEDNVPKRAKAITVNTHFSLKRMIQLGINSSKLFYMPNGADRDRFDKPFSPEHEKLFRDLRLNHGPKIVLYSGALSIHSGHALDFLLDSFMYVQDAKLLLVGTGEDRELIAAEISKRGLNNRVIIIGRVNPETIPVYIKAADVTVEPATDTPATLGRSPLKVIESIVMEKPVVSCDVGDRRELIKKGGIATPPDPKSFADGINACLRNPDNFNFDHKTYFYWSNLSSIMEEAIAYAVSQNN